MMNRIGNWRWPIIIVGGGFVLAVVVGADLTTPLRSVLAVSYLLICPGMAWVRPLKIDDRLHRLTLAVALSIAINTLVGLLLLYTTLYSTGNALFAILLVALMGLVSGWVAARPKQAHYHPLLLLPDKRSTGQ